MLIRFNVKNFLSFSKREDGKSQEFSMIAGDSGEKLSHVYADGKIRLLKFAAVFGANASGKSNLIKALDFFRKSVLSGLPKGHTDKYCKLCPADKDKESYFEAEILLDGKYYAYGFEAVLSESRFTSEWLVELLENDEEKPVFERDITGGSYSFGKDFQSEKLLQKLNIYADDVKNDESALFLTVMNRNKRNLYNTCPEAQVFRNVYSWVRDCLDINYPNRPILDYSYLASVQNIEEICRIISAFGTGITDFKLVSVPVSKVVENLSKKSAERYSSLLEEKCAKVRKTGEKAGFIMRSYRDFFIIEVSGDEQVTCKTIQFEHGSDVLFSLSEESDGTIRMLDLIEVLISGNDNKTYVIDELDRCLHPSMSYKFVREFLSLCKRRNIQLIVTTHESHLLDFDLLRRDEIWFVNKKKSGATDIYSLLEYDLRFDKKIDSAYLEGRYGGVPIFGAVFPPEEN